MRLLDFHFLGFCFFFELVENTLNVDDPELSFDSQKLMYGPEILNVMTVVDFTEELFMDVVPDKVTWTVDQQSLM